MCISMSLSKTTFRTHNPGNRATSAAPASALALWHLHLALLDAQCESHSELSNRGLLLRQVSVDYHLPA